MTLKEAAEYLNISRSALWIKRKNGEIGYYRIGDKTVRFSKEQLEEFLEKKKK